MDISELQRHADIYCEGHGLPRIGIRDEKSIFGAAGSFDTIKKTISMDDVYGSDGDNLMVLNHELRHYLLNQRTCGISHLWSNWLAPYAGILMIIFSVHLNSMPLWVAGQAVYYMHHATELWCGGDKDMVLQRLLWLMGGLAYTGITANYFLK